MLRLKKAGLLAKPLILILSFTLSGCVTRTALNGQIKPMAFCSLAEPIYWSGKDTDATIKQAKAHNAVGKAVCGWGN